MTGLPVLRHLDYGSSAEVEDVGAAGLQAVLDGGDVGAWRPVLAAVARDPWGPVAQRVERIVDHLETYGTAALLRGWLRRQRAGAPERAGTLVDLRREAGLTQRQLASRLGVSQAQVARVEATSAPSLRSLRRYLAALELTPDALVVRGRGGSRSVRLPQAASGSDGGLRSDASVPGKP